MLDSIPNKTIKQNKLLKFTVISTDTDTAPTLTYSLTGAPAGAAINAGTGVFT